MSVDIANQQRLSVARESAWVEVILTIVIRRPYRRSVNVDDV